MIPYHYDTLSLRCRPHLEVDAGSVEGHVDGVGRGVVVGPQERLLVGLVANCERHQGLGGLGEHWE